MPKPPETIKNPPEPPKTKKKLSDVNSRYRHLEDLQHFWQDGIEAIKAGYRKPGVWSDPKPSIMHQVDGTRVERLDLCVEYLKKYMDIMSERDTGGYKLGTVIDSIPRLPAPPKEALTKEDGKDDPPPPELTTA